MLLFIYYIFKQNCLQSNHPIRLMSKRQVTTFINEKTFQDVDPNNQVEKKSDSNSSDEIVDQSKRSMKNIIAKGESTKSTIKEAANEDTATEINKTGAQGPTTAKAPVNQSSLLFRSLFEYKGELKQKQFNFGKQSSNQQSIAPFSLLFSHQKAKLAAEQTVKQQKIFSDNPINMESSSETSNKGGIFSSFANVPTFDFNKVESIFNFPAKLSLIYKNTDNSKNGSYFYNSYGNVGNSEQLQKEQILEEADPSKSQMRFEYPQNCKILMKVHIMKYKRDNADLIENLQLAVLHDEAKGTYCITFSLPATKKVIFSGLLLPGKSKIKKLNNNESFEILIFSLTNDKPKKLQSNRLKLAIAIETEDSAVEFFERMTQIIESSPK